MLENQKWEGESIVAQNACKWHVLSPIFSRELVRVSRTDVTNLRVAQIVGNYKPEYIVEPWTIASS